jgi:cellulose synthase/poly-beta-1,6-N-acetylglucosamine synthase-like glycosyltransferase
MDQAAPAASPLLSSHAISRIFTFVIAQRKSRMRKVWEMTQFLLKISFWSSAAAITYTYFGYPLLVAVAARLRARPVKKAKILPTVTVIITAYNEERDIAAKLENTLSLDYPKNLLKVIVASDCSSDQTDEIVQSFASHGVSLYRQPQRLGKTAAQNAAVELATGEILLFSDATTLYRPDVLRAMIPNFADPGVGCVAGRLIYVDPSDSNVGRGARSYWSYETFLKQNESRICSLIGVSGCLYAVRRSAYVPLYNEACSDFIVATKMVEQGLRAVLEPTAICTEATNRGSDRELKMRVRVITQTFADLWRHRSMMNPFHSGFYALQLLSHKVMRYLAPFFLIVMFLTSAILAFWSRGFLVLFLVQLAVYLIAVASLLLERFGLDNRFLAFPQYFLLTNVATIAAFYKFIGGERYASWQPIRDPHSTVAHASAIPSRTSKD